MRLVSLFLALSLCACSDGDDNGFSGVLVRDVSFADPGLQQCFETGMLPRIVSDAPIERVSDLNCSDDDVRSLAGIEVLTGLRTIILSDNPNLDSLEPLTALPRLHGVYLNRSNMEHADLETVSRISTLSDLEMITSNLGDISVLANRPTMRRLILGNAGITSGVPALRAMTTVGQIDLWNNPRSPCVDLSQLRNALPDALIYPSEPQPGIDCAE